MTAFQRAAKACEACPHVQTPGVGLVCFDCLVAVIRGLIAEEREACARACEDLGRPEPDDSWTDSFVRALSKGICDLNAKAIRERGQPEENSCPITPPSSPARK